MVGGYQSWLTAGFAVDTGMSTVAFVGAEELTLTSPAFAEGEMIPAKYTCDDADISPPLQISGVPANAASLALICDDPDAPMDTWVHWVLYNLPSTTIELPEGLPTDSELADGTRQGFTDFQRSGYGGPCPPGDTHRYYFKLYALDIELDLADTATKADLLSAMADHILAETQLLGRYSRD
jgi:Raf kinase inhibitor-like YbhB/YbcL family protein